LFGRVDVEGGAGMIMDFLFEPVQSPSELRGQGSERIFLYSYPGELHLREHFDQGHFHLVEEFIKTLFPDLLSQDLCQEEGGVGVFT